MAITSQIPSTKQSANQMHFSDSFINKSFTILQLGYKRMNAPAFSTRDEEDITGELTAEMNSALQETDSPRWCNQFFVHEEVRINQQGKYGKRRKRVDIEIETSNVRPRPRLRFEAKRLRTGADTKAYLGSDGMGCFLNGSYASGDPVVGMLGYVQQSDVLTHVNSIESLLKEQAETYSFDDSAGWKSDQIIESLETFRSTHGRVNLANVDVIHTFLIFC